MEDGEPIEILISKLRVLPPKSRIEISWADRMDETHWADDDIVDYHHTSAARRIETRDRTLLLVPDTNNIELTVTELTKASVMKTLGTIQTIEILQHTIETVILKPEGISLSPYLWGYSGFLVVDTDYGSKELRIPEPGLKQYDDRLSTVVRELIPDDESALIKLRLRSGPHRHYEIIQRQNPDVIKTADISAHGDNRTIEPLIHTVAALTEKIQEDIELSQEIRHEAVNKLQSLQTPLLEARGLLCDPDPDATWMPDPEQVNLERSDYPTILENIRSKLERLEDTVKVEPSVDEDQFRVYSFHPPQRTVEDLLTLLSPPIQDMESYDEGSYVPPRECTEGRVTGDGRWLEFQLRNALNRWGYHASVRETVYGVEIDVVAERREKQDAPTDWIVAECKDWKSRPITPDVIFRLCMLAYTCRAMPVLCHTTHLTERALDIARTWEVRVLKLNDLYRGALPAPDMLDIQHDIETSRGVYTLRESRGMLPLKFYGRQDNHFTYVPGYKPEGLLHEYRSVEEEPDENN